MRGRASRGAHGGRCGALVGGALALLLAACGGEAGAEAGRSSAVVHGHAPATAERDDDARAGGVRAAPAPELPPTLAAHREAWNGPLRAVVARWVERAREKTDNAAHAGNVDVAVHVVDVETGLVLADLDASRPQRPASNMKLVTTAAALVLFGPAAEFETPFEAAGHLVDGELRGDLVVRASGDPLVRADLEPRVEDRFRAVARELRRAGLRVVAGDLVLDEGTFAAPGPGPAWPDAGDWWMAYCALSGGFSVNGGVLTALVSPTTAGAAARVELHPAPTGYDRTDPRQWIVRPRTIAEGPLTIGAEARAGRLLVQGNIPVDTPPFLAEFAHEDPVGHFGAVLLDALGREGIEVRGEVRRDRNVHGGPRLAAMRSPVAETLFPINAHSRNGVADQLFLALGHSIGYGGTRAGGQEATRRALTQLGVPVDGLRQLDGSGLSFDDAIAPAQVTALLAGVLRQGSEARDLFLASLAVAGEVGTLDDRMRGTSAAGRVRAKTGWIRGTSGLSGIATTLEGRELAFSILVEYPIALSGLNTSVFKPMQDELCVELVERAFPGEAPR